MNKKINNVLVLSGFDPTTGAGIIADCITINSLNAKALAIITSNTSQNTKKISLIKAIDKKIIQQQFNDISSDFNFQIIKIGIVHNDNISVIKNIINNNFKIVIDPIIKASNGDDLNNIKNIKQILHKAYLITPNLYELQTLTGQKNEELAVKTLNNKFILVTKTDNSKKIIIHKLYKNQQLVKKFYYQKLPNNYHGSGCILSSAIAALLTKFNTEKSCKLALDYTYQTLLNATKIGKMQYHPNHNFKYDIYK